MQREAVRTARAGFYSACLSAATPRLGISGPPATLEEAVDCAVCAVAELGIIRPQFMEVFGKFSVLGRRSAFCVALPRTAQET